jgi:hypothetical protein
MNQLARAASCKHHVFQIQQQVVANNLVAPISAMEQLVLQILAQTKQLTQTHQLFQTKRV